MTKGIRENVVLVAGGGDYEVERAVGLALSARGAPVVVMGEDERALGAIVGEIVYGGGKARHVVGDVKNAADIEKAARRAVDVFGRLDIVIFAGAAVEALVRDPRVRCGVLPLQAEGGLFLTVAPPARRDEVSAALKASAGELGARRITPHVVEGGDADAVAANVVLLCSADGARETRAPETEPRAP